MLVIKALPGMTLEETEQLALRIVERAFGSIDPFDRGYRRVKDEPGFPDITDEEWDRWDWHDVTNFNHPGDIRVHVRGRERHARGLK